MRIFLPGRFNPQDIPPRLLAWLKRRETCRIYRFRFRLGSELGIKLARFTCKQQWQPLHGDVRGNVPPGVGKSYTHTVMVVHISDAVDVESRWSSSAHLYSADFEPVGRYNLERDKWITDITPHTHHPASPTHTPTHTTTHTRKSSHDNTPAGQKSPTVEWQPD